MLGDDAGILNVNQIDATRCGYGLFTGSLYGPIVKRVVSQFCGVGFAFGTRNDGSSVTFSLNGFYCENNVFDIVRNTGSSNIGGVIFADYALNEAKIAYTCDARAAGNAFNNLSNNLNSVAFIRSGKYLSYEKRRLNRTGTGANLAFLVNDVPNKSQTFARNTSWNINLNTELQANNNFGYDSATLTLVGTGTNSAPTGTMTFNPPDDWTVNATTSVAFTGFTGPAVFSFTADFSTSDITVTCHNSLLQASATYDPPSLLDGAGVTTTVALTNAALGDFAEASFSRDLQGITVTAWVSVADTVSVRFQNETGGPIDLASGTLRARVRKA
jgi:hypothetical protein